MIARKENGTSDDADTEATGRSAKPVTSSVSIYLNSSRPSSDGPVSFLLPKHSENPDLSAIIGIADWSAEIIRSSQKDAANIWERAFLVAAARRALAHGGWAELWRSGRMPFAKSTGEDLVFIGKIGRAHV